MNVILHLCFIPLLFNACIWGHHAANTTSPVKVESQIMTKPNFPFGEDTYHFCGKDREYGDNGACLGFCRSEETVCAKELGVCSCQNARKLTADRFKFECKSALSRSRCSNACKSFSSLNPTFRRGESRVCRHKVDKKRRCFCLPRPSKKAYK